MGCTVAALPPPLAGEGGEGEATSEYGATELY